MTVDWGNPRSSTPLSDEQMELMKDVEDILNGEFNAELPLQGFVDDLVGALAMLRNSFPDYELYWAEMASMPSNEDEEIGPDYPVAPYSNAIMGVLGGMQELADATTLSDFARATAHISHRLEDVLTFNNAQVEKEAEDPEDKRFE